MLVRSLSEQLPGALQNAEDVGLGRNQIMKPLRLRTLLSVTLALVLLWTSSLQAARAWFDGAPSQPGAVQHHAHAGMAQDNRAHRAHQQSRDGHHSNSHDRQETAPQDEPSCFLTCLDASPQHYLAAQLTHLPTPELSAIYPFPPGQLSHWQKSLDPASIHQEPRGPPRSPATTSNNSARTLLLQTARLRI